MNLRSHQIEIQDTDAVVRGIDQPEATVHMILPNGTLVLKVKGGSYWSGRGERSYSGAEFQVYQIKDVIVRSDSFTVRAEKCFDFPVRNSESPERVEKVMEQIKRVAV